LPPAKRDNPRPINGLGARLGARSGGGGLCNRGLVAPGRPPGETGTSGSHPSATSPVVRRSGSGDRSDMGLHLHLSRTPPTRRMRRGCYHRRSLLLTSGEVRWRTPRCQTY
jgi:hypothetical protein